MAFREVTLTEEEQKAGGGRPFKKLAAIGDTALGFYVRKETKTVNYSNGPKEETVYILYGQHTDQHGVASTREFEVTAPYDLKRKVDKAERPWKGLKEDGSLVDGLGLAPGMGHLLKFKFSSTKKIDGRDEPMKIIDLNVDTEFKPQQPLPASVTWAKSRTNTAPPPPADDIPF